MSFGFAPSDQLYAGSRVFGSLTALDRVAIMVHFCRCNGPTGVCICVDSNL